ncbi:MAG: T9SS type A sorting domain-containing protein [Bacteroidia bacterium]
MNKKIVYILLIMLSPLLWRGVGGEVFAQKIYPLHGNATIMQYNQSQNSKPLPKNSNSINGRNPRTSTDSLHSCLYLPFYDDFSYSGPYPNASKWLDQYVFVNHTKAISPPTLGVATFDGLNQYGFPYDSSVASTGGQISPALRSDTLTSFPIRLDSLLQQSLSPADSVYLSFYYQSMGYWEQPASSGYELDVDFYSPIDSAWYQVWSKSGYYPQDSLFHLVMLPITDAVYFGKGFQFRFRNKSCGCGDDDHWHIDVVSLYSGRNNKDTIFNDVSFVYDLQSPLKNYTQMPYNQYMGASDMKTHIVAFLRNNSYNAAPLPPNKPVFINTYYNFFNTSGNSLIGGQHLNGSNNLNSYYNAGYCNDTALIRPSIVGFVYTQPITNNDSFTVKFYVGSEDTIPQNDTITFHQVFSNYFSYDDGSAEGAFGIESTNGSGNYQIASRFMINKKDTLRSIDIFFDPIIDVSTLESSPFNLVVWGDNGGIPGNPIYTDTTLRYPHFPPNTKVPGIQRENMFNRYVLLRPLIIDSGQVFYIGINQIYNYPAIPIGFDMNTDYHNNFFYNANTPIQSVCQTPPCWFVFPGDADPSYRGALMMHPVFGDSLLALGIKKYNNTVSANINIYPNPTTDEVFIQSENTISKIIITDLLGNIVIQQSGDVVQIINTSSLQSGVYLVKAFTDKGLTDTKKLIIAR